MRKLAPYAGLLLAASSIALLHPKNEVKFGNEIYEPKTQNQRLECLILPGSGYEREKKPTFESTAQITTLNKPLKINIETYHDENGCVLFDKDAQNPIDLALNHQNNIKNNPLERALHYFRPIREAMLEYHCTPNPAIKNDSLERVSRDLSDELRAINNSDSKLSTILHLQQLVCDELSRSTDLRAKCYLQSIRGDLSDEGASINTAQLKPANCYQYLVIIKALPNEAKQHWYNLWIGIKQGALEHEMLVKQGRETEPRASIEQILNIRMTDAY